MPEANASTKARGELSDERRSPKSSVEDPNHPGNESDVVREDVMGGNRLTGMPANLVEDASKDETVAELTMALRRMPVGSFQFIGDLRTPEASIRAAFELRRLLNEQGLDVCKLSAERKKELDEIKNAPVPTPDPVLGPDEQQNPGDKSGQTDNRAKA